jgi:hypothetical protein
MVSSTLNIFYCVETNKYLPGGTNLGNNTQPNQINSSVCESVSPVPLHLWSCRKEACKTP